MISGGNDRFLHDGDKLYLNFSSNDYLELARHPEVIAAWQRGEAQATRAVGGWLMVDDAHGIGMVGEEGRGCAWALEDRPALLVVTFGKAVRVSGAAALGFTLAPSNTSIQSLVVGENLRTLRLAERLRITLTSAHQAQDIDVLLEELSDAQSDLPQDA